MAQIRAVVFEKNVSIKWRHCAPAALTLKKKKNSNAWAVSAITCKFDNVLFLNNYTEIKT